MNPVNRKLTLIILISGVALVIVAMIIGIADNLPGITVMFVGVILIFLALIHFWRSEKSYLLLMLFSFLGGVVFAVLHNLLDALSERVEDIVLLPSVIEGLSVACFFDSRFIVPGWNIGWVFWSCVDLFLKT